MTTDGSTPGTSINAAGPEATLTVTDLPEGRNVVEARAISGAGVPAADSDVGTTEVDVDKTAPDSLLRERRTRRSGTEPQRVWFWGTWTR